MPLEQKALADIEQARSAARRGQVGLSLEEIDRAETILLNRMQLRPDPHVDQALRELASARDALSRKDTRAVEQQLAAAADLLNVGFGSSMPQATPPPVRTR
jgi:flagellin-specific chaperone FliS